MIYLTLPGASGTDKEIDKDIGAKWRSMKVKIDKIGKINKIDKNVGGKLPFTKVEITETDKNVVLNELGKTTATERTMRAVRMTSKNSTARSDERVCSKTPRWSWSRPRLSA